MRLLDYFPASVLAVGAALTVFVGKPKPMPLAQPLATVLPDTFMGYPGHEVPIGADEKRVSGVTDYFNRGYDVGSRSPLLLYVGYHATQQGDNRMHSPSLCLPGVGWTPVSSSYVPVPFGDSTVSVNRYVLQKDQFRILVYYWFQGRGRVTAGETALKLHAILDAFFTRRDEETLVRIVVPIQGGSEAAVVGKTNMSADTLAKRLATNVIPQLQRALPAP